MTSEKRLKDQAAFRTWSGFFWGSNSYAFTEWDSPANDIVDFFLPEIISGRKNQLVSVAGILGYSSSIATYCYHLRAGLERQYKLNHFFEWKFLNEMGNGHNIIMGHSYGLGGFQREYDDITIVGGMTDYSGEGGRAYQSLKNIVGMIADIFVVPRDKPKIFSHDAYLALENEYFQAEKLKKQEMSND